MNLRYSISKRFNTLRPHDQHDRSRRNSEILQQRSNASSSTMQKHGSLAPDTMTLSPLQNLYPARLTSTATTILPLTHNCHQLHQSTITFTSLTLGGYPPHAQHTPTMAVKALDIADIAKVTSTFTSKTSPQERTPTNATFQ
ncbi:hypothetical protein M758_5G116000 [Ceratodon purpureus]|nr:hypothetical protein M758_5G115800 [Ceratodon purpureus]KAG0616443.1 hypothetical protein M758_5G116000 [Ceratodon purpureus]